MTKLIELPAHIAEDFRIEVDQATDGWTVRCNGTLDHTDASTAVQPLLLKLHQTLVTEQVKQVRLELFGVDYINSSGLKSFMSWFLKADQGGQPAYKINVIFDPKRTWQAVSLGAMAQVAPSTLVMTQR